jgi:hypothetical protein
MELEQVFDHFSNYHMKILLRDFNVKLRWKDIFKPTTGNVNLHQDSNSGVRLVKFAIPENLVVTSKMFPHQNIHKYTLTSPHAWEDSQPDDHILLERIWHSSILDELSFRKAASDTDRYLVVAKVTEKFL